jgi:hypothetical protein
MLFNVVLVAVCTKSINKRFEDMRSFWRAERHNSKSVLCEEFRFTELRALIERNHSEMLSHFAGINARLSRLENER